jgi:Glycosyl transferase family 11
MDRKVIVSTHYMPGNTGIQLAVAHILQKAFGCSEIETFDCNDTEHMKKHQDSSIYSFTEKKWNVIHTFIEEESLHTRLEEMMRSHIYVSGYFQNGEPLILWRSKLLEWFKTCESKISTHGTCMSEFMTAEPPIKPGTDDIVLHVRLGDFVNNNMVIDPAPQIAILRKSLNATSQRLIIVCRKPKNDMEENYLKFFEEFHPILHHGTELEDFALLRSANRIMVTNSTFSWLAAYMGSAKERWIPEPTYNTLEKIDSTDILYRAENHYLMQGIQVPSEPFLPVTGEFLQGLCEYTVLDRAKKEELHKIIDYVTPVERQIFIEEPWPKDVLLAKSIFVYPTTENTVARHVFKATWPNLRLIVFHNSDYGVDYEGLVPFLEAHPEVWCWAQNATVWHPRIRCVPICEENRMWRGGNAEYEPTVTVSRNVERHVEIFMPYASITNPIRIVWKEQADVIKLREPRLHIIGKLQKEAYLEWVESARAMICPPGNGVDTHRHWDALVKGAWAIVHNNEHTRLLMRTYPSLHLLPIDDMEHMTRLEILQGLPPFHPLLVRQFWETLFRSHIAA